MILIAGDSVTKQIVFMTLITMISPKKSWLEIVSEPAQRISILMSLSASLSNCSYDDTDGGGNSGAGSSMSDPHSRSTDKAGSIRRGNSRIHKKDSSDTHSSGNQLRFRLKPARQNAARERKPIHLPSMQLTEAFSL
jgi:hypothetical protein